jgi:hypothetical protein
MSNPAVAHLIAAREAMVAERDAAVHSYNEGLRKIDALIADFATGAEGPGEPAVAPKAGPPVAAPSQPTARPGSGRKAVGVRSAILGYLTRYPHDHPFKSIYEAVQDAGEQASEKAVRNLLDRMALEGSVQRLGRGRYRKTPVVLGVGYPELTAGDGRLVQAAM